MDQKNMHGLVSSFSIEYFADRYRVNGVPYQGNVCTVDISKALLDAGRSHMQADWIEMTRQGEWKVPSGPLYFAVLGALYDNKDAGYSCEKVRRMLARDFKDYVMMTSTDICYAANGLDKVIHDFGYATERVEEADIIGVYTCIDLASEIGRKNRALWGIDDGHRIEILGEYSTGKKPHLWCLKSKPKEDVAYAMVFRGNDLGVFGIYASDDFYRNGRARGMVARRAENSP